MRLFVKPEPRPLFAKSVLYIIRALDYYLGFPPRGPGGKVYHYNVTCKYSTYVVQNLLT